MNDSVLCLAHKSTILLPSLVVYASLSGGVLTLTLVDAICGGLWLDSLSANPLGTSMLAAVLAGLLIQRSRDLILRQRPVAQLSAEPRPAPPCRS
jgi:hypothetical protein